MQRSWKLALAALVLLGLNACTSAPELEKYSRTEIDRPYTLPSGLATWSTIVPVAFVQSTGGSAFLPPIPVPLFWKTALSDSWTLNFSPLPTSASYQISSSAKRLLGTTFGSSFGYASGTSGVSIEPAASFFWRERLSPVFALEFVPSASASFYTGGRSSFWNFALAVRPLYQITPLFAARLNISLGYAYGAAFSTDTVSAPAFERLTLPIGASTVWSVGRQWDLNFSYTYDGIGYGGTYSAHVGRVEAKHYW